MPHPLPVKNLILVPALITLGVTLLRLVGELMHWSSKLFNPAAGGGGAIVGIAWLVPIFGAWFGWRLAAVGAGPAGALRAIGYPFLGMALVPVTALAGSGLGLDQQSPAFFWLLVGASIAGAIVAMLGWRELGRVLFAYGLAARIPVVLVMLAAILGDWGTHYDVPPPNFPPHPPLMKWFMIGVVPQLTFWMFYTIAMGGFVGGIAGAIKRRSARA